VTEGTLGAADSAGPWVLGQLAAGGVSNPYYPAENHGLGLTFPRACHRHRAGTAWYRFSAGLVRIFNEEFKKRGLRVAPPLPVSVDSCGRP